MTQILKCGAFAALAGCATTALAGVALFVYGVGQLAAAGARALLAGAYTPVEIAEMGFIVLLGSVGAAMFVVVVATILDNAPRDPREFEDGDRR